MLMGMGDLRPCCPVNQNIFSAIFSNTCDYCTQSQIDKEAALMQLPVNQGNTSGVPNCDPNMGWFAAAFSNDCNLTNPIGNAVGLPQVPQWVWVGGLGILGLVFVRTMI